MLLQPKRVIHFHNGAKGGVFSVIKNIVESFVSTEVEHHIVYTINKDIVKKFSPIEINGMSSTAVFYYSSKWNFYHTSTQLSKYLLSQNDILVVNDWLELGMISILGLNNPVVQIVHGDFDYYYDLAAKHIHVVDQFIAVSSTIAKKLKIKLSGHDATINYSRFPVQEIPFSKKNYDKITFLYFVSSLSDTRKNFHFIPQLDRELIKNNIEVNWIIAGDGYTRNEILDIWSPQNPIRISTPGFLNSKELLISFYQANCMILPSFSEGFPVSVVEAMKAGLIPIVSNWDGAVSDLIIHGETGFYVDPHYPIGSADLLLSILKNKERLSTISLNASGQANILYNSSNNTQAYISIFIDALLNKKSKSPKQTYGSRLDKKWIPNFITAKFRHTFSKFFA
jgi:glycosyltransferase involved in cell wall biosynthesis